MAFKFRFLWRIKCLTPGLIFTVNTLLVYKSDMGNLSQTIICFHVQHEKLTLYLVRKKLGMLNTPHKSMQRISNLNILPFRKSIINYSYRNFHDQIILAVWSDDAISYQELHELCARSEIIYVFVFVFLSIYWYHS